MPRTRVQRVGPESVSLQALVPWCSSCNGLILRNGEVTWRSELLQRLQEVRGNCKTRNQLYVYICGVQPTLADTSPLRKSPYGVDATMSLHSREARWF